MIKVGLIGAGKMGISHLAILGAHPDVEISGVCDTSKMVLDVLEKYSSFKCYTDYRKMISERRPDAVVVAVPTKMHAAMVRELLEQGIHVFVEKPFCLHPSEAEPLITLAKQKNLVNQVGYHNKWVGTFAEVKRLLSRNAIGEIYHFHGQAYGPVVVKQKQDTWRSSPDEGGGCLMDYASHVIDLINYLISPVQSVPSSMLKSVFSRSVEDAVFAMLKLSNGVSGVLSVNWSDETYRKMTTSVQINGRKGKIVSDANELKVFFNDGECPQGYSKGWNVKYVTDLTPQVDFYLRGEEYTAQMDHFISAVKGDAGTGINTFESASHTDRAIDLIRKAQFS
ncbi:Gfo/Idh/MocA family protein [Flavihumibacter solisilvae]|uniref:Oxidoreductase n=1 Tax=Flavihumibacter solisilvae TaxID=1349421 RepID=A0A0C1IJE9_9BACT|nr:Gfo/Idh/MocA family oxidoreductase [Flavihumibacter solisilvae]KIC94320.1 oxidoreductase [Flavihumibacter solisilvae]